MTTQEACNLINSEDDFLVTGMGGGGNVEIQNKYDHAESYWININDLLTALRRMSYDEAVDQIANKHN